VGLTAVIGCALPGSTSDLPEPQDSVSFKDQIQPIFNADCIDCHVTGGSASLFGIDLLLTEGESYNHLVNQVSVQDASLTLVAPGDAESSLLFLKVNSSSPPVGEGMPLAGSPISASDQALIRDWINQGALDN
jgi:DNA polymerase II small subunit/DNA polymerase delta subunit B